MFYLTQMLSDCSCSNKKTVHVIFAHKVFLHNFTFTLKTLTPEQYS